MPSRRSPDPFAAQLGERIRKLRNDRKLSLSKLARLSGISRGHLSDLEQGKAVMTVGTLGNLGRGLEVPPFVILLVPKDDPDVVVVDQVLEEAGGDPQKAATRMRVVVLEREKESIVDRSDSEK
ncbi:MAG TPA: helix-turn-helix transcriptional regulator [Polyangium sp.]|nr:helix-turn-helix transcriptional regulator [Polyangium sp.]